MKRLLITLLLVLLSPLLSAETVDPPTGTFGVQLNEPRNTKGQIRLALYISEETYMVEEKAFATKKIPADQIPETITFENLPYQTYALTLMHDENMNDKLDTNFLKIPKEEYAFSNNAVGKFGPAKFEQSKFDLAVPTLSMKVNFIN